MLIIPSKCMLLTFLLVFHILSWYSYLFFSFPSDMCQPYAVDGQGDVEFSVLLKDTLAYICSGAQMTPSTTPQLSMMIFFMNISGIFFSSFSFLYAVLVNSPCNTSVLCPSFFFTLSFPVVFLLPDNTFYFISQNALLRLLQHLLGDFQGVWSFFFHIP